MKIAFVDTLGLPYDGSTLEKRGLGGSESAVIYLSRELVKLGHDVAVFNNCWDDDNYPGDYAGVHYWNRDNIEDYIGEFDVVIGSRSITSFNPDSPFASIIQKAKHKVLWMHDTFCEGDDLIEQYINRGLIDEIFTLSDWHTSYVTNCDHGFRRNFDALKHKVFQTRNGVGVIPEWVDVTKKNPNLFVYNASVTKGMIPLVTKIWPKIKEQRPEAELVVIGGYYRFSKEHGPDQQEQDWHQLVKDHPDIHFTGVITQQKISDILRDASFFLYPTAFPETFGISTLEALAHNVTPITCRFGALEETAVEDCSYKINYPVEKNWSCQWLDEDDQVERFVQLALDAYGNKYLHQQKMYACNRVKDVCGWDSVALQWTQHLYRVTHSFLPIEIHRKAQAVNHRVAQVFGRRFVNKEAVVPPKKREKLIQVVTPVYNSEKYIERCIESVASQDYDNWEMTIIDDASTDATRDVINAVIARLPWEISNKISVWYNDDNKGAVYNQFHYLSHLPDTINMLLDGDDWLVNDPYIFDMYNNLYHDGAEFTYGSCWSLVDNIPLIAQEYPPHIRENGDYRKHLFNWNMPYTHLRTFCSDLVADLSSDSLKDADGNWYKAGGDAALFYALIELADPAEVVAVSDVVYVYNDTNPLNDYKVNGDEQTRNANAIIGKKEDVVKKKILIAIPCKNDIEADTFKSIYDLIIPEGYETEFQYYYGYAVDQVRNLIADWMVKGDYDYLLAVDHDMVFPADTLVRLLDHDASIVSGIYVQRLDPPAVEAYDEHLRRLPLEECYGVKEVGGVGMGCALIKKQVFVDIGYPQYHYTQAVDHANTFSEDLDFCVKAHHAGHKTVLDCTLKYKHIGQREFVVPEYKEMAGNKRFAELGAQRLLPSSYVEYMRNLNIKPKVAYDIGSCVLHWSNEAHQIWPDTHIVAIEGMREVEELYKQAVRDGVINSYAVGSILGSHSDMDVEWYENLYHPGGNSVYRENPIFSPAAPELFPTAQQRKTITLDDLVEFFNFPLPDLIKIDVQGSELNVLRGAAKTLKSVKDVIVELQNVQYNIGAPDAPLVIDFMEELGFKLVGMPHKTDVDGDCHFTRVN